MVLVVQIMKGSSVAGVAVFGCKRSLRQFATSAQLLKQVSVYYLFFYWFKGNQLKRKSWFLLFCKLV